MSKTSAKRTRSDAAPTKQAAAPQKQKEPAPELGAPSDIIWGCRNIARVLNISERAAFHLLQNDKLESARKVGGRHVASRAALLKEFGVA